MNKTLKGLTAGAVLALATGVLGVTSASAAPAPVTYTASVGNIPVITSVNGTGAAVIVNAAGTLSLTVGTPSASTYAQADLSLPAGSVLPATAPTFTTDAYAAGSPRWVLELGNGGTLFDDQSGTAADAGSATAADWTYDTGSGWSAAVTYAAAVAAAGGAGQVVTGAYIVADGDQPAGTTDVISAVQYGGQKMTVKATSTPKPHLSGGHVITVSNNTAQVGWKDGPGVRYVLTRTFGFDMTQADGSPHYGFTGGTVGYWGGLAAGHTYDVELIPAGANRQPLPGAQVGWINVVTTR